MRDFLKKKDQFLLDDVKATVTRVASDPNVPTDVSQRIAELWALYTEMKNAVESPRGTLQAFDAKAHELGDKHNRLVQALRQRLGLADEGGG